MTVTAQYKQSYDLSRELCEQIPLERLRKVSKTLAKKIEREPDFAWYLQPQLHATNDAINGITSNLDVLRLQRGAVYEIPVNHRLSESGYFRWLLVESFDSVCVSGRLLAPNDQSIIEVNILDVADAIVKSIGKHGGALNLRLCKTDQYRVYTESNGAILDDSQAVLDGTIDPLRSIPSAIGLEFQGSECSRFATPPIAARVQI